MSSRWPIGSLLLRTILLPKRLRCLRRATRVRRAIQGVARRAACSSPPTRSQPPPTIRQRHHTRLTNGTSSFERTRVRTNDELQFVLPRHATRSGYSRASRMLPHAICSLARGSSRDAPPMPPHRTRISALTTSTNAERSRTLEKAEPEGSRLDLLTPTLVSFPGFIA